VPDYSIQSNGSRRRFITDHLGSIRLVVDAATGVVHQVVEHDAFGRRTVSGRLRIRSVSPVACTTRTRASYASGRGSTTRMLDGG
jgi:hypothetical protein